MASPQDTLHIRQFETCEYADCWQNMRDFTNQRNASTSDEIWLLQHKPVFTQGQNGKPEHVLNPGLIPVVQTDRGGQVTYHGPGQLMIYTLIDISRKKISVRQFVNLLENTCIEVLQALDIQAYAKCEAPGVYLKHLGKEKKIASIGLRVRRGCTFHGIAFNVNMDLQPFKCINPCGFSALEMVDLAGLGLEVEIAEIASFFSNAFSRNLMYTRRFDYERIPWGYFNANKASSE